MKKFNVKRGTLIGVALGGLAIAQLVLGGQKDALEREDLKSQVVDEVMKKISEQ